MYVSYAIVHDHDLFTHLNILNARLCLNHLRLHSRNKTKAVLRYIDLPCIEYVCLVFQTDYIWVLCYYTENISYYTEAMYIDKRILFIFHYLPCIGY